MSIYNKNSVLKMVCIGLCYNTYSKRESQQSSFTTSPFRAKLTYSEINVLKNIFLMQNFNFLNKKNDIDYSSDQT